MTIFEQMAADAERVRSGIAPGTYRLVMFDTFSFPPEPAIVAEGSNLEALKRQADALTDEFHNAVVYDSTGACAYTPKTR